MARRLSDTSRNYWDDRDPEPLACILVIRYRAKPPHSAEAKENFYSQSVPHTYSIDKAGSMGRLTGLTCIGGRSVEASVVCETQVGCELPSNFITETNASIEIGKP